MSSRPTRKQPPKKRAAGDAERIGQAASAATKATGATRKRGRKKKRLSAGLAVFLCLIVIVGTLGYCFTGKTVHYYYLDDGQYEYTGQIERSLLASVKYRVFDNTDFIELDDYFTEENGDKSSKYWALNWYYDEDGTRPALPVRVGFSDLFQEQPLYGWLTAKENTRTEYEDPSGYYDGVEWTADGLYARLRAGFAATGYSFAGQGGALIAADTPKGADYVYGIYNAQKFERDWMTGKNFEREHVWCNSLLGMARVASNGKNQASDLHNLRAIGGVHSGGINQTRSNRYFTDCALGDDCTLDKDDDPATHHGHAVGADAFYPGREHVGDVSRILMYMIVMYRDILRIPASVQELTDARAYNKDDAFMPISARQLLIDWNAADPVDDFERNRNEVIYGFQGNRNPFIDYETRLESVLLELIA
ncbi:MAG: endonuclease [Clostridiales bacterium]|jgi:endonuclease I|nr:endonuclease [Clostridiales bacterium]